MEEQRDIHNTKKMLTSAFKKIQCSNFNELDKQKITEFTNHCTANGVGNHKMARYLNDLYHIGTWLGKPFETADKKDIERIMVILQNSNYSEWTKRGIKIILKKYYKWLRNSKVFPDEVEWIKTGIKECKRKLPEEMLNEEEIKRLIEACITTRDKAFVSVLYDAGCRIGELLNLKFKDIEIVEYGVKICLMGKTGMRKILLIFSAPYLIDWLNQHPTKDYNSYLWVKRDNSLITYDSFRFFLIEIARRAKVKKKVNPHNFRHSRASYYANKLTDAQMKRYFGWNKSETVEIYTHLSGKDIDNAILRGNGIIINEVKEDKELKPIVCVRCKKVNKATDKYCSMCSFPLDEIVMKEIKQKDLERKQYEDVMEKILADPRILEIIKEKMMVVAK